VLIPPRNIRDESIFDLGAQEERLLHVSRQAEFADCVTGRLRCSLGLARLCRRMRGFFCAGTINRSTLRACGMTACAVWFAGFAAGRRTSGDLGRRFQGLELCVDGFPRLRHGLVSNAHFGAGKRRGKCEDQGCRIIRSTGFTSNIHHWRLKHVVRRKECIFAQKRVGSG
jgi:hypothetical protein